MVGEGGLVGREFGESGFEAGFENAARELCGCMFPQGLKPRPCAVRHFTRPAHCPGSLVVPFHFLFSVFCLRSLVPCSSSLFPDPCSLVPCSSGTGSMARG